MRLTWRDRHTVAAGAAACAVCCAAPVLGLLGIGVGGAAAPCCSSSSPPSPKSVGHG